MTQSKKPSKSSKSKKTSTASTSKKVKSSASEKRVEVVVAPAVLESVTMPLEPVVAPVAVVVEEPAPVRTMSRADFMELVRKEAYHRATRRNFQNGSPFQDWVDAEAAVSGKLAAEGVRLS